MQWAKTKAAAWQGKRGRGLKESQVKNEYVPMRDEEDTVSKHEPRKSWLT